jgi:hypothetical protein
MLSQAKCVNYAQDNFGVTVCVNGSWENWNRTHFSTVAINTVQDKVLTSFDEFQRVSTNFDKF